MRPKLVALAATVAALLGAGGFLASTSCGCRGIDVSRSPQISGSLGSGNPLIASVGTWTSVPKTVTYQWIRCDQAGINCRPIPGASTGVYVQADGDGGSTLAVIVTATNDVGQTTSAQSGPTGLIPGLIPVNATLPAVSGDAFWASTNLTASPGAWTNSPTSFAYQWQDCNPGCSNIAGATGQSYIPTQANVGHTLQVAVTARNTAGPATSTSTATAAVGANGPPTITLSGQAVSWPAQPGATSFQGAASTAPTGGTTTYYPGVTSPWTPAAQCGQTLYYAVASEGPAGEQWSTTRVPITWPACQGASTSFIMGVNDGVGWGTQVSQDNYNCAAATSNGSGTGGNDTHGGWCPSGVVSGNNVGFHWDRIDPTVGGYPSGTLVSTALAAGWNVLVTMPSADPTTDVNIMNLYKSFGSRVIFEFTNEPNLGTTGVTMTAAQYAAAYQATRNAKVAAGITQPLLFYTMGTNDGGTNNGNGNTCNSSTMWLADAVCAVPSLQIDGFAVHPYGEDAENTGGNSYGVAGLKADHAFTITNYPQFANANWYLTEFGYTLDPRSSGHNDTGCVSQDWYVPTFAQQEAQAWTSYSDLITLPWVAGVWWYQTHDDGSGAFGLVTSPTPASTNAPCASEPMGADTSGSPTPFNPRPILSNTDAHTLGNIINQLRLAGRLG